MQICDRAKCTACSVCVNVCTAGCIDMQTDDNAFLYPIIDENRCIKCGKCQSLCPQNTGEDSTYSSEPGVYCCQSLNDTLLHKSSSGGMFYELAKYIICDLHGVVYASEMSNDLSVRFTRIDNIEHIEKAQGSKYVQSIVGHTYSDVKCDLKHNTFVMFIGCPCQVFGLRKYLKEEYVSLLTVDLVCHGVGSTRLFTSNISSYEKGNDKIINVRFRSKDRFTFTNHNVLELLYQSGKTKFVRALNDRFMAAYYHEAIYRDSCYTCKYASVPRVADITIGDYAGIDQKLITRSRYKKGVSLLMTNSEKGVNTFEMVKPGIWWVERPLDEAIRTNKNIAICCSRPEQRDLLDERDISSEQFLDRMAYSFKNKLGICLGPTIRRVYRSLFGKSNSNS